MLTAGVENRATDLQIRGQPPLPPEPLPPVGFGSAKAADRVTAWTRASKEEPDGDAAASLRNRNKDCFLFSDKFSLRHVRQVTSSTFFQIFEIHNEWQPVAPLLLNQYMLTGGEGRMRRSLPKKSKPIASDWLQAY